MASILRAIGARLDHAVTSWLERPWDRPGKPVGMVRHQLCMETCTDDYWGACMTPPCTWESDWFWSSRAEAQTELDDHLREAH